MRDFCIVGKWYYYHRSHTLYAHNQNQAKEIFTFMQGRKNVYFVGYVEYEFYRYLFDSSYESTEPYCVFYGFTKRKKLRHTQLESSSTQQARFLPTLLSGLDRERYGRDFAAVKHAIATGRSYEVNLTQNYRFRTELDSLALFFHLKQRQNTPYTAYIPTANGAILSFSPELFFTLQGRKITTEPMKGTIKRSDPHNKHTDKQEKQWLKNDSKTRSENVMIVDLLRNDIAKISKKHSLSVKLFRTRSYPTLHQMISRIQSTLKKRVGLYEIFEALFPCGSITGAPKIETIRLITELEQRERGVYCGSIGCIYNGTSTFSVAIRTLTQCNDTYNYGVGSGLVWESNEQEEYDELRLKAEIIRADDCVLFETMRYNDGEVVLLHEHLRRLVRSARELGFSLDKLDSMLRHLLRTLRDERLARLIALESTTRITQAICDYTSPTHNTHSLHAIDAKLFSQSQPTTQNLQTKRSQAQIARLTLTRNGSFALTFSPLQAHSHHALYIAQDRLTRDDALKHKTSLRGVYDTYSPLWQKNYCYDVAFCNEKGELCEASRTNIVLQNDDRFYTPSLSSGLLNGVYRQFLIDSGVLCERVLYVADIYEADAVYCINSVRGAVRVSPQKGFIDTKGRKRHDRTYNR